jgi:hypothetical protein
MKPLSDKVVEQFQFVTSADIFKRGVKIREVGEGAVRDSAIFTGIIDILPVLKVPRLCSVVLLLKVYYREVKALGSIQILCLGS